MKNPWTKKSEKKVYSNPWIELTEFDVITPGGSAGIYGKVHFKNYALGIIPLTENHETILVGQYRFPLDIYSWEIPMGGGPLDMDPLLSAQKELKEETGITAQKWTKIMELHTSNSVTDELGMVYVAEQLSFGKSETEDTEEIQTKQLPFIEVVDMVMKGKITDAISVAGILKLHKIIGQH